MATRSDELTDRIRTTRGRMDRTLDDLGERAGPGRLTQRLKGAVANTRDTVMGAAGDTGDQLSSVGGDAADAVRQRSRGNPLAAGLVAFGAGLLAGSALPESRRENRLADEVQRKAQGPLREQVQQSAGEVADRVGGRIEEAKDTVAGEAAETRDEIAGDVGDRAGDVRDHARSAADDARAQVERSVQHHSGQ